MSEFYQEGPELGNQYDADALLRSYLRWKLPPPMLAEIEPDLRRLGERVVGEILSLGNRAEAEPPRHVPFDAWGRRVDEVVVGDGWRALERVAAEEGFVAIAYERRHGALSRVHQMARVHLFHPSSATYTCPLAMADGAARFLEIHAADDTREAFARLTTRDPDRVWTSGQWMTERTGGSDVARTSTVARRDGDGYRLAGSKWFVSAVTSPMAMALARIEGAPAGNRGLSVFLVELRDDQGQLRGIRVERLKDKLGTRALPTAELTLDGATARLVGGEGDGVRKIAAILNITRAWNAVAAVAGMRRALALARDYATRRSAFGKALVEQPLHVATLAELEARYRASFMLTFQVVELMGREECGEASDAEQAILRLLTPAAKAFTGRQAVAVASEALECFGGAGYIEDTGIARLLRDAQVLPIWEGTTNVLSLDVWRAIERTDALAPWLADVRERMDCVRLPSLFAAVKSVREAAERVELHVSRASDDRSRQAGARKLAFAIARTAAGARLVEHAAWSVGANDDDRDAVAVARQFAERELASGLSG